MNGHSSLFVVLVYTATVFTDILYIDNEPLLHHKQTTEAESHLPLSSLFAQSDKYKCLMKGRHLNCHEDDQEKDNSPPPKVYFGPRFQKIHLALPRRELKEVTIFNIYN